MDRFNELEHRWEERQKKRKLAFIVIGGCMLIYVVIYLAMPSASSTSPKPKAPSPVTQAQTDIQTVNTVPAPPHKPKLPSPAATPKAISKPAPKPDPIPVKKEPTLTDPLTITLDRSFQDKIEAELLSKHQKQTQTIRAETKQSPSQERTSSHPQSHDGSASGLQIKSEAVDDSEKISLLIDHYEFNESYENAMKIARHYFATKTYRKAIEWSLAANRLNSAEDESWLIFAKASIAVGETEQAKKALQTYLLKRDSLRIRQLYQSIK